MDKLKRTHHPLFFNYICGEDGSIFSVKSQRFMKGRVDKSGYVRIHLPSGYKLLHRLIAECFLPRIKDHNEVNHIDGVKTHNSVSNLEWSNRQKNMKHACDTGLKKPKSGSKNGMHKISEEDVLKIRKLIGSMSGVEIANIFNVSPSTIHLIKIRKTWKHI